MNDVTGHPVDTAVLPPETGRPGPPRADAWSLPGPRRKARREFRPRRRIPGVLVAAVIAAAGIVGCIWAASAALGHPLWNIPHNDFAGPLQSSVHWDDTGTLIVASAVAFVGSWVWPVVAAASFLIAVLALWWMAAQTRTGTVRRMPLEPDRVHGTTTLRADAATGAMTDELESQPSIRAADALLHESATTPGLRLGVIAENRADPRLVRADIENEALPHLRDALELDKIPTVLRLQFSRAFDRRIT